MEEKQLRSMQLFRLMDRMRRAWTVFTPKPEISKSQFGTLLALRHGGKRPCEDKECRNRDPFEPMTLSELAKIMNQFPAYDVTMSETHHIHKLDAPSGTAITLAEEILENLDRKERWVKGTMQAPDGTVSGSTECAANELPVSSIREGEVPGIHVIRYESEADSIILTHDAKNRKGFALGAVLAAEFTANKEGYLGMSDLFPFLKD